MVSDLIWSLGATVELQRIYNDLGESRGEDLLTRLNAALGLLRIFPESAPLYFGKQRRPLVGQGRRYGLFYVIEGNRIVISAVADLRGHPDKIVETLRRWSGEGD